MPCKKGQFGVVEPMVNNQLNVFGINLNAQPVNEMTHFAVGKLHSKSTCTVIRYYRGPCRKKFRKRVGRVVDLLCAMLLSCFKSLQAANL